jgi:fatty-acid desaturase
MRELERQNANRFQQNMANEYHLERMYKQTVFDKQPEPCLLCDLVLIAAIGAIGWLIWWGVARAI